MCVIISVICLQETGMTGGPDYNLILKGHSASTHGGLAIYVRTDLNFDLIDVPNYSENIWECISIQVYGKATGGSKHIIGNVYRPPRDRVELLDKFLSEFNAKLEFFDQSTSVNICGDFNLDVLKSCTNSRINRFMHESFATGYFPKILLPTRITKTSQTLIDNILCKFSSKFHTLKAGILTHRASDHQPYFLAIDMPFVPR